MKGLAIDEPAFHVTVSSSLNPFCDSAISAAYEHAHQVFFPAAFHKQEELSSHGSASNLHSAFPSQSTACNIKSSPFAETQARSVDCYGNSLSDFAEAHSWWETYSLRSIIPVPPRDEEEDGDHPVCRGISRMEGGNELVYVGEQASMEARKEKSRNLGFKSFMGTDTEDCARNVRPSIAVGTGFHSRRLKVPVYSVDQSHYIDDLSAAMVALTCKAGAGDLCFGRFLPSNQEERSTDYFSSDDFRMYEFKVRRCMRGRSHDWTECPFAHPGEKARRRDPRSFPYSGSACPDFRRGACRRGDACELSHGVFECWLHPARYRTQLCKDGKSCTRRVCFFAHSPSQLRLPHELLSNDGFAISSSSSAAPVDATMYRNSLFFRKKPGYGGDLYSDDSSSVSFHGSLCDGVCDTNLRSKLAMASSLPTSMEQIMSPTSTLTGGHALSPPPSPSEPSPLSPGPVYLCRRSTAMSQQQSISLSGQPQSQALMASLAQSKSTPPLFAHTRGPSPLSTNRMGDRQHDLEGFGSLPTSLYLEGLKARNLGQLGRKEAGFELESPDIGWVSELVK